MIITLILAHFIFKENIKKNTRFNFDTNWWVATVTLIDMKNELQRRY